MDIRATYETRLAARKASAAREDSRSKLVGSARILVVLGALGIVAAVGSGHLPGSYMGAALGCAALFAVLVVVHAGIESRKATALARARTYERGLARLADAWRDLPEGPASRLGTEKYGSGDHPYAADLDLFGKGSLAHRIDTTATLLGAERLAGWLAGEIGPFPEAASERQVAAKDLAGRLDFREEIAALGGDGRERIDPKPFLAWVLAKGEPIPTWVRVLAKALPVVTVVALTFAGSLPRFAWAVLLAVQLVVGRTVHARVEALVSAIDPAHDAIDPYVGMLTAIERETFSAPLLVAARDALEGGGVVASREMAALARAISFLDARKNGVFRLFVAPFLSWDLNCAIALERWRTRTRDRAAAWLAAVADVEALSSLGTLASEEAKMTWPALVLAPSFVATGLVHPLLPRASAVPNDVTIEGRGHVLVVTGSNMSGKSTLLRAIGTNAVLALAGAPVAAQSLRVGEVKVTTSMRIGDSLESGVSHFYAELRRLKVTLDAAGEGAPPLFLLDEILHGTNARERIQGARAVLRALSAKGALGCVSTHDLAIGSLEADLPGLATNVHFEEQVDGDQMTFDYKMKPGIVQSSNALRLMKALGLPIGDA